MSVCFRTSIPLNSRRRLGLRGGPLFVTGSVRSIDTNRDNFSPHPPSPISYLLILYDPVNPVLDLVPLGFTPPTNPAPPVGTRAPPHWPPGSVVYTWLAKDKLNLSFA